MIIHLVEFFFPGVFISESSVWVIPSRTNVGDIPDGAYGYRVMDQERIPKFNGRMLKSEPFNVSGMVYFGVAYTLDEVERLFPTEKTLISNMKTNGPVRVVKTRCGNFHPLDVDDVVIPAEVLA